MSQFNVLLSGDAQPYINTLRAAFEESPLFKVVALVPLANLTNTAAQLRPDVAVVKLEDEKGLAAVKEMVVESPMLLAVLIVDDPGQYDMLKFLNIGIRGCLPVRLLPRQIVNAVELVVVAGLLCYPRLNPGQIKNNGLRTRPDAASDVLTVRERQILVMLGKSYSNQEIADALCLSESTVKTHLRNIFRKLRVRNRSEAISLLFSSDDKLYNDPALY